MNSHEHKLHERGHRIMAEDAAALPGGYKVRLPPTRNETAKSGPRHDIDSEQDFHGA